MLAVLVQQVLLDQVHMGDALHLFLQVGVVLDVDAAAGHAGGDGPAVSAWGLGTVILMSVHCIKGPSCVGFCSNVLL